ncbi:MAG TPA: glycosyltransferase family 4 protein [Kiritimatiellia bacterium]|nr:glycosyltransferase family 4 protein [Kiritimatiellia bacterium]
MKAIHQLVAGFSNGDAISNEARVLQSLFRSWGCASDIFCENRRILPELRTTTRDLAEAATLIGPEDAVILHLSIGSPANLIFPTLPGRKVIYYHNITPPHFFRGIQEEIAAHLRMGLDQTKQLAGAADLNLAVSRFNADELEAIGYRNVEVIPLMLDPRQWEGPADRAVLSELQDGLLNILFVGRCAPNKCIEDLLFATYYLERYVEKNCRLIHVGSSAGLERYEALLRTKAQELGLSRVHFAGSVRPEQLRAYYQSATVFLCLSEHEGFCIPLLEAMAHRIPVLAYAAGAVPDTLQGAGVLFHEKRFDLIAETIGRIARDSTLRSAILEGQTVRLNAIDRKALAQRWQRYLIT